MLNDILSLLMIPRHMSMEFFASILTFLLIVSLVVGFFTNAKRENMKNKKKKLNKKKDNKKPKEMKKEEMKGEEMKGEEDSLKNNLDMYLNDNNDDEISGYSEEYMTDEYSPLNWYEDAIQANNKETKLLNEEKNKKTKQHIQKITESLNMNKNNNEFKEDINVIKN